MNRGHRTRAGTRRPIPGQLTLFDTSPADADDREPPFLEALRTFVYEGKPTERATVEAEGGSGRRWTVPAFVNEFWTSRQRAAHSLHEVSYRACFKPQLPRFFIERLTKPGDLVYDPFMGRGTTLVEAALLGRRAAGCDVNPLSGILVGPRLRPPTLSDVAARLASLDLTRCREVRPDLDVFYHPETLTEICALREYLLARGSDVDLVDAWIRMVAVNRLTGHSPGFFSVYTLPPNQAASVESQRKINARRHQQPPRRDVRAIVLKKSRALLADCDAACRTRLRARAARHVLVTGPAHQTPDLPDASVSLVVTSPPFLDVVDYAGDNWLRCWFCGIDPATVSITIARRLDAWGAAMASVFAELHRVVKPGGYVAFEVGEVRGGTVKLEETVIPAAAAAGWSAEAVMINAQAFTKTANCWGVTNNTRGTNTNRIVVLRRS